MGQDTHSVLWANTTMGVLPHATERFDPLCYVNTKNTSTFGSKSNFLRIVLNSHCLWDKGRFALPKKASCPGYGARRPLKWKKNSRVISAVSFCGLCHFIIERYEHYTKRTNFPI